MAKDVLYSQKQLIKKVKRMRNLMSLFLPSALRGSKSCIGKELYLDTQAGKVRTLSYNLENHQTLPLFVNIHGSGFTLGNAEMDDPYMMNIALSANVKIISIDYRLAPEYPFPAAINECYAVVAYAKEHPDEFGIDPHRIAVGGHSAGGNFTTAIALMDAEKIKLGLKCIILDYPPMDIYTDAALKPKGSIPVKMARLFDACYCINKEKRKNPLMSPVYASREQLTAFPPTLVMTARKDSLCAEAEHFKDMLIDAGVDVTFKQFDAVHGFNLSKKHPLAAESWQMQIDFLKRYL